MTSAIIQYFLNDHLEPDEIRWQMQQLAAAGYQGVYPHARAGLSTPYGSAAWWAALDTILECCQQHGLEFWIWDEDYYPSGWAGGRVVWENPGLAARRLAFSVSEQQGALIEADFEPGLLLRAFALSGEEMIDVTEHCGTRRQTWGPRLVLHRAYSPLIHDVGHPHWRAWMSDNRFALEWRPPHAGPWTIVGVTDQVASDDYPDILRPEGIARFLELTHAAYHQRYGREFGRTIKGCFTDEPSPAGSNYPWTPRFASEFERDHGYNLLDHLPHLALDIDSRTPAIRHHYRATQGRLLTEHYTQQIGAWCDEHQIALAGHLTRTEWLSLTAAWWPNEIRCYQPMHIPSADPLGGSVGFPDAGSYATGLKVASSAAHLFGRAQAGGDVLAVVGEEMGLRDLRYLLDLHLVMGINHFTLHGASYSFAGPRKDEVPPSLFVQHSQWRHFDVLMQHLTEQAAALTGGEHVCHLALLYPSTSLACQVTPGGQPDLADERPIHQLVELLLRQQSDFDFLDELSLQEKVDQAGRLTTPEPYQVILLPYLRYLEAGSAAALERFAAAGGRVVALGQRPELIGAGPEPTRPWACEVVELASTPEAVLSSLPRLPLRGAGREDVFALHRRVGDQSRLFLVNRREAEFEGEVDGLGPVRLAPHGSQLLQSGEAAEPLPEGPVTPLTDGWTISFEPNQLPLNFWHVASPAGSPPPYGGEFGRPAFDLLRREADPAGAGDGPARYWCRFMLTGGVPAARLVVEAATFGGRHTLYLNDQPVSEWREERLFGMPHLVSDVGALLRGGSTPTLNVLRLDAEGPGRGVHEVPYLLGHFNARWPYAHPSLPHLVAGETRRPLAALASWDALGYPSFSGTALYERSMKISETGDYWLDLGRVEDVAAVSLDGEEIGVRAWAPYRVRLANLAAGPHALRVEVTNAPANRTRLARLPAGLLGPVTLIGPASG